MTMDVTRRGASPPLCHVRYLPRPGLVPQLVLLLLLAVASLAPGAAEVLQCNVSSTDQDALERWTTTTGLTFSRDSHAAAVFRDKIWVVGGVSTSYYTKRLEQTTTRSDVVSTADGKVWTEVLEEAPFRRRFGHTLTTFTDASDGNQRLVLLGGFSPEPATDVWTSLDGVTWTEVTKVQSPWAGRGYHCSVVFQQRLWIMGGSPMNNDVWSTTSVLDGPWIQQANVPWKARAAHACAAHKVVANVTLGDASIEEYVFLLGGWDESTMQDVWRMDSTGTWTQLMASAPWDKRAWHSLVSFDSRTNGDVELGPRLWLIGGGIIGNGVQKMHPHWDVWYSRNGSVWIEASSDASGISTADWSMVSTREKQTCTGKWGQTVVQFVRKVTHSYYCHASCNNEAKTVSYANQIIPMCNPAKAVPDPPLQKTVLIKSTNSVVSRTLYPDGCGICYGSVSDRYVNSTTVPALYLIGGNVGTQKVKDVFHSNDAMLCEQNGVICSNKGTCTQGGTCLCVAGKTGQFCESESSFTVVDDSNCFPPTAQVTAHDGTQRRIADIQPGDKVLAMDQHSGRAVFSTVYYLPHDNAGTASTTFVRIFHTPLQLSNPAPAAASRRVLEITPLHLLYVVAPEWHSYVGMHGTLPEVVPRPPAAILDQQSSRFDEPAIYQYLLQLSAREVRVGDLLVTLAVAPTSSTETSGKSIRVAISRVEALATAQRRGATTLYTTTGTLFVDGVLCSCFADLYPAHFTALWQPRVVAATAGRATLDDARCHRRRQRDAVVRALFMPHRLLFTALPFPATARLLRRFMDAAVLPWLHRLWLLGAGGS